MFEPSTIKKVHFNQDEKDERIVDIYVSAESLTVYENPWVAEISPPNLQGTAHPVPAVGPERKNPCRAAATLLGLLCLLLLAGIIGLGVQSSEDETSWSLERNQMQDRYRELLTNNSVLTTERDSLIKERKEFLRLCDEAVCAEDWQKFGCSCYNVSTSMETWGKSRRDCKKRDARLVIISSREEQEFLIRTLLPLNNTAWIGDILQDNQGVWRWADTSLTTERYWSDLQPDDTRTAKRNCVMINSREKAADWWGGIRCNTRANWICEKII